MSKWGFKMKISGQDAYCQTKIVGTRLWILGDYELMNSNNSKSLSVFASNSISDSGYFQSHPTPPPSLPHKKKEEEEEEEEEV
jgi:hypothetical protein